MNNDIINSSWNAILKAQAAAVEAEATIQDSLQLILDSLSGEKTFTTAEGNHFNIRAYKIKGTEETRLVMVEMKEAPVDSKARAAAKLKAQKKREQAIETIRLIAGNDNERFDSLLAEFEKREGNVADTAQFLRDEIQQGNVSSSVDLNDDIEV